SPARPGRTVRFRGRAEAGGGEAADHGRPVEQDHGHRGCGTASGRNGRDRRPVSHPERDPGRHPHHSGGSARPIHRISGDAMNVSAPFIIRPIATTLMMIGLTLLGIVAYFVLPIAGVPQVDVPTIRVSANLPGANAETMATSVATPLEGQLSLI